VYQTYPDVYGRPLLTFRVDVPRAGEHQSAVQIDDQQRIDVQLLQRDRGDVGADEFLAGVSDVVVDVHPIAPVRGGQLQVFQVRLERIVDALHRGAGIVPLQRGEAWQQHLLLNADFQQD
jgi:hypothetical protein